VLFSDALSNKFLNIKELCKKRLNSAKLAPAICRPMTYQFGISKSRCFILLKIDTAFYLLVGLPGQSWQSVLRSALFTRMLDQKISAFEIGFFVNGDSTIVIDLLYNFYSWTLIDGDKPSFAAMFLLGVGSAGKTISCQMLRNFL
jgi:hypothetical protein